MGTKADYYRALSDLTYVGALHTLSYLCDETRQCLAQTKASIEHHDMRPLVLWPDEAEILVEALSDPAGGFIILNEQGVILRCDDRMAVPFGCPGADLLGRCLWDVPGLILRDQRIAELRTVMKSGRIDIKVTRDSAGGAILCITIPLAGPTPCAIILSQPIKEGRVFEEAFKSDERRIIE